jgi:hypothetical protein
MPGLWDGQMRILRHGESQGLEKVLGLVRGQQIDADDLVKGC